MGHVYVFASPPRLRRGALGFGSVFSPAAGAPGPAPRAVAAMIRSSSSRGLSAFWPAMWRRALQVLQPQVSRQKAIRPSTVSSSARGSLSPRSESATAGSYHAGSPFFRAARAVEIGRWATCPLCLALATCTVLLTRQQVVDLHVALTLRMMPRGEPTPLQVLRTRPPRVTLPPPPPPAPGLPGGEVRRG